MGVYVLYKQDSEYESLMENGRYTIAVGKKIEKRRTGREFIYIYKVKGQIFEGGMIFGNRERLGFEEGKLYFIVYNPKKPKKDYLIKYPAVPVGINMEDVPFEGWTELPVPVEKDSIKNFLND
jgi:hypothetical protein